MTPPRSIVGSLATAPILRRVWLRRTVLLVLIAVCAVFTLFPQRYRAAVTLTPTDPASLGLASTLGQLGALNSVFGNQAAIEVAIKVAKSVYVRQTVAKQLKLREQLDLHSGLEVSRWLDRNVTVRTMRGGIVQIETYSTDATMARALVDAVAEATRQRLGEIARRQTGYKRDVLVELVAKANSRLTQAQAAYNLFRLRNGFYNPVASIEAVSGRIPQIQAALKAKEVDLYAARQFGTDDTMAVQQILAEQRALRAQLAQLRASSDTASDSVGRSVTQSTEAERLERELASATALYYAYRSYLQGTAVEDLTSGANLRILEPAFIDTARQLNYLPLTIGLLLAALAVAIEFYGLRPPVGSQYGDEMRFGERSNAA